MNSRERVRAALNFEEPDRVPLDLGGTWVSGIHGEAYSRLRKAVGIEPGPVRIFDLHQMLAQVELPVIEALGADVLPIYQRTISLGVQMNGWKPYDFWWTPKSDVTEVPTSFEPEIAEDGSLLLSDETAYGVRTNARMPANGWYFDILDTTAMSDEIELEDIGHYKSRLRRLNDEDLQFAERQTRTLFEETDKALAGGFMLGGLSGPDSLTFADWMIALITEKEYVRDLFEAKVEVTLENLRAYRDAVGDRIDIVVVSGVDYGTQRREMFSPNLFEELFVPYYRQINDWIHSNTDWKTFFHSCGSVRGFIEHFIDAGVDILNPVQTTAANMDPAELKNEYGRRIAFWGGGVDTQHVLPFGTPDEVREQVLDRLRVFAPGGGFIFNTAHNVQAKVPTENMMSMYDTVKQRGRYPIVA